MAGCPPNEPDTVPETVPLLPVSPYGRSKLMVEWMLEDAGLRVDYHESEGGHHIDPRQLPEASMWLGETLGV